MYETTWFQPAAGGCSLTPAAVFLFTEPR